jgi:glycosyltransferase involved in cell wall biosynthesis
MMCDSNSRAGYFELLQAFQIAFKKDEKVKLLIKDRYATDTFKDYIEAFKASNGLDIELVDKHITDLAEEQNWYDKLDSHVFINKSSTFALTVAQGMAKAIPTITMAYSGPRDYCNELNSCLVDYSLEEINHFEITSLTQKGLRNYLFTPALSIYPKMPRWAVPSVGSLAKCLRKVYEDKAYRDLIGQQGRVTAESLSWDRAAINLSYILSK